MNVSSSKQASGGVGGNVRGKSTPAMANHVNVLGSGEEAKAMMEKGGSQ